MGKPWKPGKATVALPSEPRPSRIRRDPRRVETRVEPKPRSREREMWSAVLGVAVVAACCAALVIGVSQVTSSDPAAARAAKNTAPRFGYCRTARGPNCVEDGDTFFLAGERIEIAGIDAPELHPSRCPEEARRGIAAAVRLRELLNRAPPRLMVYGGRPQHKVEVNGVDVGAALVAGGFARELYDAPRSWC